MGQSYRQDRPSRSPGAAGSTGAAPSERDQRSDRARRSGQGEDREREPFPEDFQPPSQQSLEAIVVQGSVEELVDQADRIGEALKNQRLSTSQIRNVFGTVRQIQMRLELDPQKSYREAVLLRPKLGYFAEREKKARGDKRTPGMESLQRTLDPALQLLSQPGLDDAERHRRFERIVDFLEAIVAYHKKHGGAS